MSKPDDIRHIAQGHALSALASVAFDTIEQCNVALTSLTEAFVTAILDAKAGEREAIAAYHDHEREVYEQLAVGYYRDIATKWQAQKCLARASHHRIDADEIRKLGKKS